MAKKPDNYSTATDDRGHAPHSADDWEVLFEDPQNDPIVMIGQAMAWMPRRAAPV